MAIPEKYKGQFYIIKRTVWWTLLTIPSSLVTGSVAALMLWSIDMLTLFRIKNPRLVLLLPLIGLVIFFILKLCREKSSNVALENIHDADAGVTARSAFPIFITTLLTHVGGGSAGREGAVIQIGGSIGRLFGGLLKLDTTAFRIVATSGMAAAFGAIFGAPVSGALFALETVRLGSFPRNAFVPCLFGSIIGSLTCSWWGIHPTQFQLLFSSHTSPFFNSPFQVNFLLMLKVAVLALTMGILSCLFFTCLKKVKIYVGIMIPKKWLIPVLGGVLVILLSYMINSTDYLGLGLIPAHQDAATIATAFKLGGTETWGWLLKLVFTLITLGFGFRGGEVTPLLFIGAALGNIVAFLLDAPIGLFACLGFISVFAAAGNVPFACTFLGVELFGGQYTVYYALACFIAYFFGPTAQNISSPKSIAVPKVFDEAFIKETSLDREIMAEKFNKSRKGNQQDQSIDNER